ncbi:MAG TPA: Smr/MutS family protein, partial [Kofleriaceae bacterium]|nr:Smr/MutS family protein [Kofleriaceae bacterium]
EVTSTPADRDTLAQLGWDHILSDLAGRCRTGPGAVRAAALEFLPDPAAARARMAEIGEARQLATAGAALPLGGIGELADPVARAGKGSALEPAELIAVGQTARGCDRLRRHLADRAEEAPRLAARAAAIADLAHVFHPILEAFDDGGRLVDHASDALGPLRKQAARARTDLERRARDLVDDPRLADALQDRFYTQRDERCVLPIKVEARGRVKGIVHGTSQSGQTVFVEPEALVELGNQLVMAESAVADEERRILALLSSYVAEDAPALRESLAVAAGLDLIAAAADQAAVLGASAPALAEQEGGGIDLVRARHPLMELSGRACVPNDVRLPRGSALVISGPNAGGKTVALKTTGLAVLMARAGLHVSAAASSALPWIERLASDIGDAQSLEKDLSTFSGHLLRVQHILAGAGPDTLVLFDELAVGTEPEQGAALAEAVLEALVARGASVIATTHYERLKILAAREPRFANASVGFDLDRMMPTFELHLGVPGSSGALALARRLGVDADLVARAESLLGDRRASVEELLAQLAHERDRLAEERRQAAAAHAEAERARAAAERATERAIEREQKARQQSHDEAVAALRDARRELDELRATLRRRRREAVGSRPQGEVAALGASVDAAAARIAAHAPARPAPPAEPPPDPADLTPGTLVRVVSLNASGTVVGAPDGNRVAVQVGPLRTTARLSDLRVVSKREQRRTASGTQPRVAAKAGKREREHVLVAAPSEGRALTRTPDATLDLRGERVDDGLAALDRFLDESMRESREVVFIIHGHGTGALRSAVRDAVRLHPSVVELRPGEPNEGGDGVTVCWLDV